MKPPPEGPEPGAARAGGANGRPPREEPEAAAEAALDPEGPSLPAIALARGAEPSPGPPAVGMLCSFRRGRWRDALSEDVGPPGRTPDAARP